MPRFSTSARTMTSVFSKARSFCPMRAVLLCCAIVLLSCVPAALFAQSGGTKLNGKVTLNGAATKPKPLDLSKEPACAQMHAANPLVSDSLLLGPGNAIRNVVVYISEGAPYPGPAPKTPVLLDQQGCQFTAHVLVFRVGQEVKISNSDPLAHNIHTAE